MKAKVTTVRETVSNYRRSDLTKEELFNPTPETREKIRTAETIEVHAWYHEAETKNDILVVFSLPSPGAISVGDELEIDLERFDVAQDVQICSTGKSISINIAKNNVHDLRMPMRHGGSRFPSAERRSGA